MVNSSPSKHQHRLRSPRRSILKMGPRLTELSFYQGGNRNSLRKRVTFDNVCGLRMIPRSTTGRGTGVSNSSPDTESSFSPDEPRGYLPEISLKDARKLLSSRVGFPTRVGFSSCVIVHTIPGSPDTSPETSFESEDDSSSPNTSIDDDQTPRSHVPIQQRSALTTGYIPTNGKVRFATYCGVRAIPSSIVDNVPRAGVERSMNTTSVDDIAPGSHWDEEEEDDGDKDMGSRDTEGRRAMGAPAVHLEMPCIPAAVPGIPAAETSHDVPKTDALASSTRSESPTLLVEHDKLVRDDVSEQDDILTPTARSIPLPPSPPNTTDVLATAFERVVSIQQ